VRSAVVGCEANNKLTKRVSIVCSEIEVFGQENREIYMLYINYKIYRIHIRFQTVETNTKDRQNIVDD